MADVELAGTDRTWWSNRADESAVRLTQQYDLSPLAPGTPLTLTASMWWEIEADYDYGYVMASRDGEHWQILPGKHSAMDNPSGNALGPGYTDISGDDPDRTPQWVDEQFDLSAYAGGPLWLQFSYVTDDAVNLAGWMVDDVQLAGPDGPLAPLPATITQVVKPPATKLPAGRAKAGCSRTTGCRSAGCCRCWSSTATRSAPSAVCRSTPMGTPKWTSLGWGMAGVPWSPSAGWPPSRRCPPMYEYSVTASRTE